jgi:topoisomerase IV subunit B
MTMKKVNYTEDSIQSLDWYTHIRRRPGMYIGKLGDGSMQDDGIYVLLKEAIDNSIDEFNSGRGSKISISIENNAIHIQDYGGGIPLGKVLDCVSKMNTGARFDSKVFKKSVGLNGVGLKAVNALSEVFVIESVRDGSLKRVECSKGILVADCDLIQTQKPNGTSIFFKPDNELFVNYAFDIEIVTAMIKRYCYLNIGLQIYFNQQVFISKNGSVDLIKNELGDDFLFQPYRFINTDIEITFTYRNVNSDEYFSFVNGQFTSQGGTHLQAFKDSYVKVIREFYNKNYDVNDIKQGLVAFIAIRIQEPIFESQTKTKLGSKEIEKDGISIQKYISSFLKKHVDDYLHINKQVADIIEKRIIESEKQKKAISNIQLKQNNKRAIVTNLKLRDSKIHYNSNHELRHKTMLFITEGNSASGSITKSRNPATQAVFSLKGKPLNTFEMDMQEMLKNEELLLLTQSIFYKNKTTDLRYNKIVIATDSDVDGMHIRMLLTTFFLSYFPQLITQEHVYILETPLFRVRNNNKTIYCYSEDERIYAINHLQPNPEITRFKGLGEISPDEFSNFIGENIRLEKLYLAEGTNIQEILSFYMGKNTKERQEFICNNLKIESF